MARTIELEITIPAPPGVVWDDLADLAGHAEWMADAESVSFVGEQRSGVGTKIEVLTRIGPVRLTDAIEFTAWRPPFHMGIRHRGFVSGEGSFLLAAEGDATRFTWIETLRFPLIMGGVLGEAAAAPVLRSIWRKNLRRLSDRFG